MFEARFDFILLVAIIKVLRPTAVPTGKVFRSFALWGGGNVSPVGMLSLDNENGYFEHGANCRSTRRRVGDSFLLARFSQEQIDPSKFKFCQNSPATVLMIDLPRDFV